jgi:Mrp family chromosome partitioning ATPase
LAAYATHVVGSAVLLVDANLENASLSQRLGTPNSPGLVEALANPDQWNGSLHRSKTPNVWLMPAGRVSRQTRPMASLAGAGRLLEAIRNRFPFVVVDLPPAPESVFSLAIAECLDGVLLVLEAERMRVQVVERAKQLFSQSRVNLLGAVLNKRRMHIPGWLYRRL